MTYEMQFATWVIIAVGAGVILTSAAVATGAPRDQALIAALVAAGVVSLVGVVFYCGTESVDGCLGPFNVMKTNCAWRPSIVFDIDFYTIVAGCLCLAILVSGFAALSVLALRLRRTTRADDGTAGCVVGALPTRARLGAIAAAVTVLLLIAGSYYDPAASKAPALAARTASSGPLPDAAAPAATSDEVAGAQIWAWLNLGGSDAMNQLMSAWNSFYNAYGAIADASSADIAAVFSARIPPSCQQLTQATENAEAYFGFPVAPGTASWAKILTAFQAFSSACETFVQQQASDASDNAVTAAAVSAGDDLIALKKSLNEGQP